MKIEGNKVSITRKKMKEIKKMDRKQIEELLEEVLVNTKVSELEEGLANVQKRYRDAIEQTLSEIKGIGEKRKELFMELFDINIAQP